MSGFGYSDWSYDPFEKMVIFPPDPLSGHSTISRPHPVLKRYEQRVHTMDQLIVSFQRWAGSADWWAAKTIAGSYMSVAMGKLMVWALKMGPNLNQGTK